MGRVTGARRPELLPGFFLFLKFFSPLSLRVSEEEFLKRDTKRASIRFDHPPPASNKAIDGLACDRS
jgi:hypothetical protein